MANVQSEIESRIRSFIDELNGLVRQAAVAAVGDALGGAAPVAKRGPGRPRKTAASPVGPRVATRPVAGGKRAPGLLAKTVDALRHYVVQHPGKRVEHIAPALGVTTKDLALPVKKLLAAKSISRKGQKRATTYWPIAKK